MCRRVEPCAALRQVSQNALAQIFRAFTALGRPVARCRQQVLKEGCIDVRVGVVPQLVSGCAFIECCCLHQVFQLAKVIPPAFANAACDPESFPVAGKPSVLDEREFVSQEVERLIMAGGRIELRILTRQ